MKRIVTAVVSAFITLSLLLSLASCFGGSLKLRLTTPEACIEAYEAADYRVETQYKTFDYVGNPTCLLVVVGLPGSSGSLSGGSVGDMEEFAQFYFFDDFETAKRVRSSIAKASFNVDRDDVSLGVVGRVMYFGSNGALAVIQK